VINKATVYKSSTTSGGIPESLCDSCLKEREKAVKANGGCVFKDGKSKDETCDMCLKK